MRYYRLAFVVMGCLLVVMNGCIRSESPLVDPEKTEADERLYGRWRVPLRYNKKRDDIFEIWTVSKPPRIPGAPAGIMMGQRVYTETGTTYECLCFSATVGDSHYVHGIGLSSSATRKLRAGQWTWNDADISIYSIYKYEVTEDRLTLFACDQEFLKAAIKAGKIEGVASQYATVTDTTKNLNRFVVANEGKLFTRPRMFTRVD